MGNPGGRPLNNEPTPPADRPAMPKGMSKLAQKEWRRIVPQLLHFRVKRTRAGKIFTYPAPNRKGMPSP